MRRPSVGLASLRSGADFAGRWTRSSMSRCLSAASRTRFARQCSIPILPPSSSMKVSSSVRAMTRRCCARSLRSVEQNESAGHVGVATGAVLKQVRPELDLYLCRTGGSRRSPAIRRRTRCAAIFYAVEELLELHLAILEGVQDRYDTPFFDNLKKYAQRPIGTFHALPIARGKSVFKSDWIRDMGEFYGPNAVPGREQRHHWRARQPAGADRQHQEGAGDGGARVRRRPRLLRHQRHVHLATKWPCRRCSRPATSSIVDRNCHKSHHYGMVLAGAQPLYVEAFPMTEYSMYGAVPLRTIKQALLNLKARRPTATGPRCST